MRAESIAKLSTHLPPSELPGAAGCVIVPAQTWHVAWYAANVSLSKAWREPSAMMRITTKIEYKHQSPARDDDDR